MKRSYIKRKPNKKRKLANKADLLWKLRIKELCGDRCEVCGEPASPPHHYIPKSRNALLRYDLNNGVPLCIKCHYIIHFDVNPDRIREVAQKIRDNRGKEWCDYVDSIKGLRAENFQSLTYYQEIINMLE